MTHTKERGLVQLKPPMGPTCPPPPVCIVNGGRWDTHFAPKCGDTHGAPKFCEIKFATERTDRELLGRPVARYSATFVFLWYKSQFCEIKFATERTDRELLGRLVARYSAVFLFYVVKVGDRPRGWSDPVSRFLILRNMPFSATEILDFLLPCFLLPGGGVYPEIEFVIEGSDRSL